MTVDFTGCKKLIPVCKKRQGTTSVVPPMANLDSGFSRCGIASN
jgi:hypothetical protein